MKKRNIFSLIMSMALTYTFSNLALAQQYPNRPIRLVVPFAPGGGADHNARIISERLGKRLGQTIIIDNKPGGGGTLAANMVVHSAPDGYTLLYTTPGQQMINPHLMEKLPYDPVNGLLAITKVVSGTNVLVVNKDFPANTVTELIAFAKANPGKINFASSGIGATSHLAGELFKSMAGINIVHVPYKGSGPAVTDVIGGRVEMSIDTISVYLPYIKSGSVRALGVSTPERNSVLPDTPAISDELPGFDASPVNYISAPARTPRAIIDRLNLEINVVLNMPTVQSVFLASGVTGVKGNTPEQMEALIKSESAKWKKVVESSGAKL